MTNLISFKNDSRYCYPEMSPEELGKIPTRMFIELPRWEEWKEKESAIAEVMEKIPELQEFEEKQYRLISKGSLPAKELAEKLIATGLVRSEHGYASYVRLEKYWREIGFEDLEEFARPFGYPANLKKIELGFPEDAKKHPYQEKFTYRVDRGGHDGIANGGSYGWYRVIWSDGKIEVRYENDRSKAQHGHRLNYHHDLYDVVVTVIGGTWVVVKNYYDGQIYSFDDYWEVYGEAPEDFRRYPKFVI